MNNLSIIIPVKNGEKYLEKSIKNNLENMSSRDEIIYIDDWSNDNTFDLIKKHQVLDNRIKLFKNNKSGLVSALNYGVEKSANMWIARADVDDEYPNVRLNIQRNYIKSKVAAIFCDYQFIDENSNDLGTIRSPIFHESIFISLTNSQRTPHPGVVFNKRIFNLVGGYQETDFPVEDLSLWLRMSFEGELISCPDLLLFYRLHGNSVTARKKTTINQQKRLLLKKYSYNSKFVNKKMVKDLYLKYNKYPENEERKILFIRDLIDYLIFHKKYIRVVFFVPFILKNILKINNVRIIIYLNKMRKIRSNYRSNYKSDL